jgi:hypothetical protein
MDRRLIPAIGWTGMGSYSRRWTGICKGSKTLGDNQTVEVAAIEAVLFWYRPSLVPAEPEPLQPHDYSLRFPSAIARSEHSGAGPGQKRAKSIQKIIVDIMRREVDPPI